MELIECWHLGDCEIQMWSLTPREASYFIDRDNERRKMAIFRYWVKHILTLRFLWR